MGLFKTEKEKLQIRLRKARVSHNLEKMRAALADGAEVDYVTQNFTELFGAAYHDFREGVALLLEHKADPNTAKENGYSALMSAANDGYFEIAKLLIEHGAEVNAVSREGKTALHFAAKNGRGSVIKLLMENGADPKIADYRMNTPADMADKEYPRLADLLRGKRRDDGSEIEADTEIETEGEDTPVQGWRLTSQDEVSNITDKPDIGYRLTEIFNFGSGMYTRIAHNMKTDAESQTVRFFDEFTNRAAIDRARQALEKLGGQVADDVSRLDKPVMPKPGLHGGNP